MVQRETLKITDTTRLGIIPWRWYQYEDKALRAEIEYKGLLRGFKYEIFEKDTILSIQIKKQKDWKLIFLSFLAGGSAAYFLLRK